MFAALIDNLEFFKTKINIAIMLAPVTIVHKMEAKMLQKIKNNETLVEMLRHIYGEEILCDPVVESGFSGGLFGATDMQDIGLILGSDSNPELVS